MSDVSPPSSLRVFPDTGALLSMLIFPRDRLGNPTLAGEVLDLYQQGAFALIISRAVVDELEEVIDRDFCRLSLARYQAAGTHGESIHPLAYP